MCLVEIPQAERELGPVSRTPRSDRGDDLVQAITTDHPLDRDADIVGEQPLE
jgi:hypothetical protein